MRGTLAIGALAALPLPSSVAAQQLDCSFTLVCAPQIECVPHDGVPFTLAPDQDGALGFSRDGQDYRATPAPRTAGAPLTLLFEDAEGSLLFSLSDTGSAVLTEHRLGASGRVEHSSFSGTCEVVQ